MPSIHRLTRPAAAILAVTLLGASSLLPSNGLPHYDAQGRLMPPADYRNWVFLSSGIDMSYSQAPAMASGHMFNNVFVPPAAYAAFLQTGKWPDKTVLILENRGGVSNLSINQRGLVQTQQIMGILGGACARYRPLHRRLGLFRVRRQRARGTHSRHSSPATPATRRTAPCKPPSCNSTPPSCPSRPNKKP